METMNKKRIVLGAIVAGIVMIIGGIATEPLFASAQSAWLAALGVEPPGESLMVAYLLVGTFVGGVGVWLYAALKTRYGTGVRTALLAGLIVWMLNCLAPNVMLLAYGILAENVFWIGTIHDLVFVPLAVLAGSRVYRDEATADLGQRVAMG